MRRKPSHNNHEHEFLPECDDDITVEFDGEYVYVTEQCNYAPVIDSVTDYERDETYVETGPRCEAERHTTLEITEVENVYTEFCPTLDKTPELWHVVVNSALEAIEEAASVEFTGYDPEDDYTTVTSNPEGFDEHQITIEVEERTVNH